MSSTGHEHDRVGEILEVRDHGGVRSYLVRWDDDGHESILYPGIDVTVHHFPGAPSETQQPDGSGSAPAR